MVPKKVSDLAYLVRNACEMYANEHDFPKDLCGLCAIGSAMLSICLKQNGIDNLFCENTTCSRGGHCFVKIGNIVVDVTASQFPAYQHEKVLICKYGELGSNHNISKSTVPSLKLIRQITLTWDETQQPTQDKIDELRDHIKTLGSYLGDDTSYTNVTRRVNNKPEW